MMTQANSPEPEFLFVYGTLRVGFGNAFARRLQREAEFRGTGRLEGGVLVDLGSYPGLVPDSDPSATVFGDLFEMPKPSDDLLADLDAYEGCSNDPDNPGEYIRELKTVQPNKGASMLAWTYLVNRDTSGMPVIPNGDYVAYIERK